jgi:hypothetical protein
MYLANIFPPRRSRFFTIAQRSVKLLYDYGHFFQTIFISLFMSVIAGHKKEQSAIDQAVQEREQQAAA